MQGTMFAEDVTTATAALENLGAAPASRVEHALELVRQADVLVRLELARRDSSGARVARGMLLALLDQLEALNAQERKP